MRLANLNLVDYRNVETAQLGFESERIFFFGPNGQGKTNLLEAIGLGQALRSFRTSDARNLIRWDRPRAEILFRFNGVATGEVEAFVALDRSGSKEVSIDGDKVTRLGDFMGRFPSVVFCSDDLRLPRGGPGDRRKFLDLAFSSSDADYLESLRRYHKALRGRNALLRKNGEALELDAFEREMSVSAAHLVRVRAEALATLGKCFANRYRTIGGGAEEPDLRYDADLEIEEAEEFARLLRDGRDRDRLAKATQRGPHRDDFTFLLDARDARRFASEGQQRSLVLALRFGQADYLRNRLGLAPLILVDDVLGELDGERRLNFYSCLNEESQVFATGTEPFSDDATEWETYETSAGCFLKR